MTAASTYDLPEFAFRTPPELVGAAPGRYPIVIVGGGLAGLTLAADLASRGVASVLLDEDNTVGVRGASSRGIVYVQRTLEIMARLGLYERLAAKGVTWSAGKILAGDEVLYEYDYQPQSVSAQPPFINLQQFYLEWYLVDRIAELGLTDLRWRNRVVGATNHADHVALTVATPEGEYTLQADWVVAADGVNSSLRSLLQLPEHTERGQDRWCITDVRFQRQPLNQRWTWIEAPFNQNRAVWQHLMADDVWRLDFQMAPDADPAEVSRPEVARERVARMLGADVAFELVWVGPYAYRTMLMERFRHGRLLFIGDAAHAKSPFGARGGNSGIQDADNLGWKLALVLGGRADATLLDSYHDERHRAAEENIRITGRSGRFLQPRSAAEFRLRRAVLNLAREHAFARSLLNTGRLCAPHHYGGLPAFRSHVGSSGFASDAGALAGKAVPNVPLTRHGQACTLVDLLREAGASALAFVFSPGRPTLAAALQAAGLPVRVLTQGEDFDDPQGLLAAQTGCPPGGVALIRPDSHLAATLPDATPAALLQAARATFYRPAP
ncbi:FAD-dependent monooxygenase [Aquabacterium sp.]|uniref:FAD-dependent monooxygenase n=1 Tax=Aquabacterium sp. TaxID=1872578 RepID=UPI002B6811B6|nr:FAD-dependent monooxygenase [Aquabacterium sp.]HSW03579.1 FAD-dependent monooxygenase [Aquabacterium sp.]